MCEVAVVICNYNKKDFVVKCIRSVFLSNYRDFEIFVVDNASTDGSVEAIMGHFSNKLTVLVNKENIGGSGGFHRGMDYAVNAGYKYILCLDNDVEVNEDTIGTLYKFMETKPEAGVCGSVIYRYDDPTCTQEMGAMIDYRNLGYNALYAKQRNPTLPEELECDYVAFCSAMLRTDALKLVGLIERGYFIYWDDMELCWRIRRGGYKVFAISQSKVYHHTNTNSPASTFNIYYYFRNKLNCFARHLDDDEFAELAQLTVERLYRTFAVNRNNNPVITTYMHALNDALNNSQGKAVEGHILPFESNAKRFFKSFSGVKTVYIRYNSGFGHMRDLVYGIKTAGDKNIEIYVDPRDGVYTMDLGTTIDSLKPVVIERTVYPCAHILDVESYEQNTIYIDVYWNYILTEEDLRYIKGVAEGFNFFRSINHGFIQDKLIELRKAARIQY